MGNISKPLTLSSQVLFLSMVLLGSSFTFGNISCTSQQTGIGIEESTVTKFVIVAGVGTAYAQMRNEMMALSKESGIEVDTLGRGFNEETGKIALPNDHADELNAGHYYHKRDDSETLSLEYLQAYQDDSNPQTIALVAGVYSEKQSALKALKQVQVIKAKAYLLETQLYMGCVH